MKKDEINSYLIKATVFNVVGEKTNIDGVTTVEKCNAVLERHNKSKKRRYPFQHNMCNGKGYLQFDDGKVFYDQDGNRQVFASWSKTCDCVNRIVDKNENLRNLLLG